MASSRLLSQNSELRRIGVWNWSLPAWAGRLPDGRTYNTCPSAGVCASACYARNGTYRFPSVLAKHQDNLRRVLDELPQWETDMVAELGARRFRGGKFVRVHDSGDFFSDDYTAAWLRVARAVSDVTFYAYTKEVARFRRVVEPDRPDNFLYVFSKGGREDHLLDPDHDRIADVFPDEAAMEGTGYTSQEESDLLAVLGPRLVGIPANNIPRFTRLMAGRTFGQWQAEVDAAREQRHALRLRGVTGG